MLKPVVLNVIKHLRFIATLFHILQISPSSHRRSNSRATYLFTVVWNGLLWVHRSIAFISLGVISMLNTEISLQYCTSIAICLSDRALSKVSKLRPFVLLYRDASFWAFSVFLDSISSSSACFLSVY